jgi:hypothetical protein
MTGYAEPGHAAMAQLDLPTIQKPFASELLLRRIRELLDSRFAANASSPHAVSD